MLLALKAFALSEFEVINVSKAHESGITGSGINIGILDTAVNENHISLKDKIAGQEKPNTFDKSYDQHGSHVAGIAIGNKLEGKPYGVTYDAKAYVYQNTYYGQLTSGSRFNYFADKGIKIINNSWGSSIFPMAGLSINGTFGILANNMDGELTNTDTILAILKDNKSFVTQEIMKLSKEKGILSVFAAGNDGIMSPAIEAAVPTFDESYRAWLAVGSLDSSYISKDSSGKFVLKSQAVSMFSNGFIKSEIYGLMAPGSNVNAADSSTDNGFTRKNGTSMAAPHVAGAAALVQQKFPFLSGAQIADVLLSTANNDFAAPKVILKKTQDTKKKDFYTVVYIDRKDELPTDTNIIKQDLIKAGYGEREAQKAVDNLIAETNSKGKSYGILNLRKDQVFAQGILDVSKAMGGLARLDANRLNKDALNQTYEKFLGKEAYYTIDTKGEKATFSNDIEQRKWDDKYHKVKYGSFYKELSALNIAANELKGLNVGLVKDGEGTLRLEGTNTYLGTTILLKGILDISKRADGSGGKLASQRVIAESGEFWGNGEVQNLANLGAIVRPGGESIDTLKVTGTYQQAGGALWLNFDTTGNSKLEAKSYSIKKMTEAGQSTDLVYVPLNNQYYAANKRIKLDLGGLKAHLANFNSIRIKDNNTLEFKIYDADKSIINHDSPQASFPMMSLTPADKIVEKIQAYTIDPSKAKIKAHKINADTVIKKQPQTQPPQAQPQPSPTPSDPSQQAQPQPPSTTPTPPSQPSNPPAQPNDPNQAQPQPNDPPLIIVPQIKRDAYASDNAQMSQTLRNLRTQNVDEATREYFNFLDNAPKQTQAKALKSIEATEYMVNMNEVTMLQAKNMRSNVLFSLSPIWVSNARFASALKDEPILLASGSGDLSMQYLTIIKTIF